MALMVEPEFQRAAEGNGQEGKGTCARKRGTADKRCNPPIAGTE